MTTSTLSLHHCYKCIVTKRDFYCFSFDFYSKNFIDDFSWFYYKLSMGIISDVGSRASFVSAKTLIGCGGHVMRRGEIPINSGQYKQFIIMNNMRQKMLIVGDNEVLKVHFLLQMSGDYDRNSVYIASKFENRVVDVTVYDKTIEVALWDTSKCMVLYECITNCVSRRARRLCSIASAFLSGY